MSKKPHQTSYLFPAVLDSLGKIVRTPEPPFWRSAVFPSAGPLLRVAGGGMGGGLPGNRLVRPCEVGHRVSWTRKRPERADGPRQGHETSKGGGWGLGQGCRIPGPHFSKHSEPRRRSLGSTGLAASLLARSPKPLDSPGGHPSLPSGEHTTCVRRLGWTLQPPICPLGCQQGPQNSHVKSQIH